MMLEPKETWLDALERWCKSTSQNKVAQLLGVSAAQLSLVRRGRYPVNPDRLQVRVETLLLDKEIPSEWADAPSASSTWVATIRTSIPDAPLDKRSGKESEIQKALKKRERGQIEVPCAAGSVDFLTATEVVEIKDCRSWKEAIKVLIYVRYFPGRSPRIHLYGGEYLTQSRKDLIESHYSDLGIRLTWED